MDPIKGTIELIIGNGPNPDNLSMTVEAALPSIVPTIVQAWQGLTNLETADTDPEEPLQVAAWTTQDSTFRPVRIILWRQPSFDETTIGQALLAAREEAQ